MRVRARASPVIANALSPHQPRQVGETDPAVDDRRPAPVHAEHALWQPLRVERADLIRRCLVPAREVYREVDGVDALERARTGLLDVRVRPR